MSEHLNGHLKQQTTEPLGIREALTEYAIIRDFPGYRVGTDGSVWTCWKGQGRKPCVMSDTWRELKQAQNGKLKYCVVCLSRNGEKINRYVHALVLEAFVGPCPPGMECRHFPDRNPANNRLENLSWASKSVNNQDKVTHGTDMRGEKHTGAVLTADGVRDIRGRVSSGETLSSVAEDYGVSLGHVHAVASRKSWRHIP